LSLDDCLITKTFDWNERRIEWAYSPGWKLIKLPFVVVHGIISNMDIFIQLTKMQWKIGDDTQMVEPES